MKKALLLVPPTDLWIREDRCFSPINHSMFPVIRPPVRLGLAGAYLEEIGYECRVADFPAERLTWDDYEPLLKEFQPDLLFVSTVFKTRNDDFKACELAKQHNPNMLTLMKGSPLGDDYQALEECPHLDVFVTREIDRTLLDIVQGKELDSVEGISYRVDGRITTNPKAEFERNLEEMPFLARHLFKNDLYVRPDTQEPLTVITAAKGCPEDCIFCTANVGAGKILRERPPEEIVDEIEDCVKKHEIKNFLLGSETFTYNRKWVIKICQEILRRDLKVTWNCTTRVDRLDAEVLDWMKRAGCYAISIGVESGNQETLDRMKKGATLEQAENAVRLIRQSGIRSYLMYILGFPWEDRAMVQQTIDFAVKLDGDITQFFMAFPIYGTELFEMAETGGMLDANNRFLNDVILKREKLSNDELERLYKQAWKKVYFRPRFIIRTIGSILKHYTFKQMIRLVLVAGRQFFNFLRFKSDSQLNPEAR